MAEPKVVVVGGGYGGVAAALALDERTDVVLVEPKDTFVHCIAALRAAVDPRWVPRIFFPYDRLLPRGRILRDRVTRVDDGRVETASGHVLEADFVVLASGSRYPFPAKSDVDDAAEAKARYAAAHDVIAAASSVLLIGAGPVGIELAGEIGTVWPQKAITLLDLLPDVMGPLYRDDFKAELRRQLVERGVRLVLGSPLVSAPPTLPGEAGRFEVETEAGERIAADVWFQCWGVSPSSDYLEVGRRDDGFLDVTPDMRVVGHERLFAVGDVTSGYAKMAATAGRQAQVAAANILALLDGSELAEFAPSGPGIIVPIGPSGGAGQLPGSDDLLGPDKVSTFKGQALNVDAYATRFNVELPPLEG